MPGAACREYAAAFAGLSKSWGLPGLRIGWIASRAVELQARVLELKDYTTMCALHPVPRNAGRVARLSLQ